VKLVDEQFNRQRREDLIDQEIELMSARLDNNKEIINNGPAIIAQKEGNKSNIQKNSKSNPILNAFVNLFRSYFAQFSLFDKKEKLYTEHSRGNSSASFEVKHRDVVNTIFNSEYTPYISLSLGKETGGGSYISGFGGLMLTNEGIYITGGGDMTLSTPPEYSITSISLNVGFFQGSKSGIAGAGYGYGGGSFIGLSGSQSLDIKYTNNSLSLSLGNTRSFGYTLTNTAAWVSGNVGYTLKLVDF
jgi:hypothetical protein